MKHFFYLLAVTSLLFASCTKPFKKVEGGLQYKIISDGKGKTLQNGNFFEIQYDQVYSGAGKDSVLLEAGTVPNQIVPMDSAAIPPVYYKIFNQSRKGDSIIVKQLTDSRDIQQARMRLDITWDRRDELMWCILVHDYSITQPPHQ